LIIFLTFGFFLLKNKFIFKKEKKSFNLPVEKPTPILSPTPTIFYLSPENIDIEIQNGSLRLGEAKKLKEKLEEKGYKVLKIGNAQEKTEITKIFIKKNIPQEFIASLSAILKESYSLATPESNLDYFNSSDSADILIVIGEK
jgi:competence CoiA-like predicted nuclease